MTRGEGGRQRADRKLGAARNTRCLEAGILRLSSLSRSSSTAAGRARGGPGEHRSLRAREMASCRRRYRGVRCCCGLQRLYASKMWGYESSPAGGMEAELPKHVKGCFQILARTNAPVHVTDPAPDSELQIPPGAHSQLPPNVYIQCTPLLCPRYLIHPRGFPLSSKSRSAPRIPPGLRGLPPVPRPVQTFTATLNKC